MRPLRAESKWALLGVLMATSLVAMAAVLFVWRPTLTLTPAPAPVVFVDRTLPRIALSEDEQDRLRALGVLRMGYIPNWYPLSFHSDKTNDVSGVAGDYAALLSKMLGLRLEPVPARDVDELRQLMNSGKVDIVPLMGDLPDDAQRFIYSEPYQRLPAVFVTPPHEGTLIFPDAFIGKTVATAAPRATQDYLREHYPGMHVVNADSAQEGLDWVKSRVVDAYIGNVSVVDALLRDAYQYSLTISGQTGVVIPLSVAVSDRYGWLVPLVNRAIEAIPPTVKRQILNSWTPVLYHATSIDWHKVARTLLPAGVATLLVLGFLLFAYLRYRKEALQRRAAEAKLNAVTRHLPAVVFQARVQSVDELQFDYVSGNSEQIWGLQPEEMRASPWRFMERVMQEDRPAFRDETLRATSTYTPFLLEFRVLAHDGRTRWIRGNAVPSFNAAGEVVWCGYWVDISDIKQQAIQLQLARDAAEQATESKTQFLAVMSHEIRTPLNGVIGMLELLRRTPMTTEQNSMAATIDESANTLLRLLDDILDLSKIEAGKMELRLQPVDLRGVVDDVVRLFNATAQSKGLRLAMRVAADVPLFVEADALRLRQMLANLVSNAIKFTHQGSVTVTVALSAAAGADQHVGIRCTVTDTGIGLDEEIQGKLFMPYVQGHHARDMQATPGGTGLGLSICRRIAEAMGGTLSVRNAEGGGTQATLEAAFRAIAAGAGAGAGARTRGEAKAGTGGEADARTESEARAGTGGKADAEVEGEIGRGAEVENESIGEAENGLGTRPGSALSHRQVYIQLHDTDTEHQLKEYLVALGYGGAIVAHGATPPPLGSGQSWMLFEREHFSNHISVSTSDGRPTVYIDADPLSWREVSRVMGSPNDNVPVQKPPRPTAAVSPKVLVAEDHEVSRRLVLHQLAELGCTVTACEDGQRAWEILQHDSSFDLLITDVHMPRLDGRSLCRRLRACDNDALRRLPVAILSATPLAEHTREDGFTEALLKPVKLRDLQETLSRVEAARSTVRTVTCSAHVPGLQALFAQTVDTDQQKLPALIAERDGYALVQWVHRQAGALATMGLWALADDAHVLEQTLAADADDAAIAALRQFSDKLSRAVRSDGACA